ncbi:MAG: tRNA pseudouridine(54/55) synthase Pus10 [Methanobrevibacter woesei]|uniref:tRNA pseudouridine(54/55) synthase Pus10 n=1 Tax=Methanobrevibacter woesei TaxID=190976 RepID=UPI0023F176CE|nr:tRNA pseudouridine(54/55) synthase Pus10 [Methanobrevibacter woesei]MCI7291077.1 tRNA pseudouridine(54/55) synthase Pus10 [Methanobrevibacter woesei]
MDQLAILKAKELLELTEGNICNHCLGRKLSSLVKGEDNLDRAKKISEELNINPDDADCVICGNIFDRINDELFDKIYNKIEHLGVEFDTFLVGTSLDKAIKQNDDEISDSLDVVVEPIKKELNRIIGSEIENNSNKEVSFEKQDIVINVDIRKKTKVRLQINPLFIEGKYNKYLRGIPQTKWPCTKCKGRGCDECNGTGKQYPESVEELLSERILEVTRGYEAKFHGAGREDIDVLMLGSGRPFVLEIKEPKIRKINLKELEEEINKSAKGKTAYHGLKFVERNRKAEIKVSSPDTYKVYKALVKCEEPYDKSKLKDLEKLDEINQQTPIRVLRRRADKVRIKHVKELKSEVIDDYTFEITIKTEGGLYIKELISGDEGRSKPNVSEILGVNAVCAQLDVVEVSEK